MAPTQPLLSFAYASVGTMTLDGAPMLKFAANPDLWQMGLGSGMVPAQSGVFLTGNFWVRMRKVGIHVPTGNAGNWVVVGHSGPNGDWVSTPVGPGQTEEFPFDADACPLFTAGEYFDAHVASIDPNIAAQIAFWWVPAT